jgi:ArsR family transcriptional regulator
MDINCVDFCKALADETRQRILVILQDGEMTVSDICEEFNLSQPSISHHLAVLKQFQLVNSRKDGKQVYYELNQEHLTQCCGNLMMKFDAEDQA